MSEIDKTKFCPDCGQSLEYLGGDGLIERSGQCEVCAGEVECDRLNADREHERNMANEWLAKAHDAGKEVATLKADLSARMSQLNEARAATVEANMALMELAATHANCDDTRDEAINAEMEACAVELKRRADAADSGCCAAALDNAEAAIRSRKS